MNNFSRDQRRHQNLEAGQRRADSYPSLRISHGTLAEDAPCHRGLRRMSLSECGVSESHHYVLDLHGHTVFDAVLLADEKVQEAWENGYHFITLIHGSPLVCHHMQARVVGRGGIKWQLRGRLSRGDWDEYVYGRRSRKHSVEAGSMTLAMRPNPSPTVPEKWSPLPEPYYSG